MILGAGGAEAPRDNPGDPRGLPGVSVHARRRCLERHGFDYTDEEWLQIWLDIAGGRAVIVRYVNQRRVIYAVPHRLPGGDVLFVGYNPNGGVICTTLPKSAARNRWLGVDAPHMERRPW